MGESMIGISKRFVTVFVLAIISVVFTFNLTNYFVPDLFDSFEYSYIESLHRWNVFKKDDNPWNENIVIVDIDYESYASAGKRLSHKDIAIGIKKISDKGASTILLDINMDFKEDSHDDSIASYIFSQVPNLGMTGVLINGRYGKEKTPEYDKDIRYAADRFTLDIEYPSDMREFSSDYLCAPLPLFIDRASYFGLVTVHYDENSRLSTIPLLYEHKGKVYYSAPIALISNLYGIDLNDVYIKDGLFKLGDIPIYYEKKGYRYKLQGSNMTFKTVSFSDLDYLSETFRGKIVLVGRSLWGADFHTVKSKDRIFGTEIIANVISSIIAGSSIKTISLSRLIMISLILAIAVCGISISRFYYLSPVLTFTLSFIIILYSYTAFDASGIEISGIKPILVMIISIIVSYIWRIRLMKIRYISKS